MQTLPSHLIRLRQTTQPGAYTASYGPVYFGENFKLDEEPDIELVMERLYKRCVDDILSCDRSQYNAVRFNTSIIKEQRDGWRLSVSYTLYHLTDYDMTKAVASLQ